MGMIGIFIPFAGTAAGAACVLFLREGIGPSVQNTRSSVLASGVMMAASVWSLLLPAADMASEAGVPAFLPAGTGFLLGACFLLFLDERIPVPYIRGEQTKMLFLAVTLHNIPEGMAVGVAFAGALSESSRMTAAGALTLALGIAIQNIPEGAVISLPLSGQGMAKKKALAFGILSGAVEPLGAGITAALAFLIEPLLPYFLSFAAGAMVYAVVGELVPEASRGEDAKKGTAGFIAGFLIMMILDVMLG